MPPYTPGENLMSDISSLRWLNPTTSSKESASNTTKLPVKGKDKICFKTIFLTVFHPDSNGCTIARITAAPCWLHQQY